MALVGPLPLPWLRQALLRYDKVRASAINLDAQVTVLKAQFSQASNSLGDVRVQLNKSSAAATRARNERKVAEQEADAARQSADESRKREKAAEQREQDALANLQTVANQRDATQAQRDAAQGELKAAQVELKSAGAAVKAAAANVKTAEMKVKTAQQKAKDAEAEFKKAQNDLSKVTDDLEIAKTNETTAKKNATAASRNAESSRRLANAAEKRASQADKSVEAATQQAMIQGRKALDAGAKVDAAQKALDQLEAQRKQLISINEQLSSAKQFSDLRRQLVQGNDIRVPVSFTLMARTFEPGLSRARAEQQLHDVFNYVATEVLPGDEKKPSILSGATLRLASQTVPLPKENENNEDVYVRVDENDIYDSLATAISRSQTPLSVRLVSDRNHLTGEPFLDVRFIIVPQRPALAADTELARATFSEKFSDARLFSALLNLADAGREVARENGVTPPLSPDAKDFYVPGSNEQIFEALRKISALGGRARVSIVTDKAISTTDQLSVRFDVKPLAPSTANAAAARPDARKAPA